MILQLITNLGTKLPGLLWVLAIVGFAAVCRGGDAVATDTSVLNERVEAAPIESITSAVRVETFIGEMKAGQRTAADADALYPELYDVLQKRQNQLREVLKNARSTSAPIDIPEEQVTKEKKTRRLESVRDLYNELVDLYQLRLRLLPHLTRDLRAEITGTDVYGIRELKGELDYIVQVARFHGLDSEVGHQLLERMRRAPVSLVWQLLELILAVVIFRWWRRWFPETLSRMRAVLMDIRPRSPAVLVRLKLLWYVAQVRSPLEWLLLLFAISSAIDLEGLQFEEGLVRIVVVWVLLGWLAVSLINAVSERSHADMAGADATVTMRLRSFRLVAGWLVFLGLGLQLAEYLAGAGALYSWVWRIFQVLAFPVFFALLSWWRPTIFRHLDMESERTETLERKLRYQTGMRGYLNAASGAAYLVASGLRRSLLRQIGRLGGRQLLAPGGSGPVAEAEDSDLPISETVRDSILSGQGLDLGYARTQRRILIERAQTGRGGVVGVVAERGGGKSTFIHLLASKLEVPVTIVECGFRGSDELQERLAEALGFRAGPVTTEQISKRLAETGTRVVAIDNAHRMARPVIGGQQEFDRLLELVAGIAGSLLWVLTLDRFAAQLMLRARAGRGLMDEIIDLPSWTPEQIGELLEKRCGEAGIAPHFGDLIVPREYLETAHETEDERKRTSIFRIIADVSAGNPALALRHWANCLRFDEVDGRLVVRLPSPPRERALEQVTLQSLLVLRVIAHSERTSAEDIAESLGKPIKEVTSILYSVTNRGWVEELDERYRLSWAWFRPISRVLERRNLLEPSMGELLP